MQTMTTDRFRECLTILGWSQRGVARMLDRDEGNVRQMARGAVTIPGDVAAWLEKRAQHAERTPAPRRA